MIALIGIVLLARKLRPVLRAPANPTRPTTVGDWIEQLKRRPDENARRRAAREIVKFGPEAFTAALDASTFIPPSGNSINSPDEVIDPLAGEGAEMVDTLGKALSSPKRNVRAAAAKVLLKMGRQSQPAVGPLAAALDDECRWVRWYAAEALANLGPDAAPAVDALLPLIEHPDEYTRRRVIEALGSIGPAAKAAVPALSRVSQKRDEYLAVRRAATKALLEINLEQIAAESAEQADEEVRKWIEQLREGDEFQARPAAKALGRLGAKARAAVPALAEALQHENQWVRAAAAEALGAMGREARSVLPALRRAAEDPEALVQQAAREAIEKITGPQQP